jgi:hypothetical protein
MKNKESKPRSTKKCIENMDESYNGEFENQSIKQ